MRENVRLYNICLTKEEVMLVRKIIANNLNDKFDQNVFGLYDNFLIPVGDE